MTTWHLPNRHPPASSVSQLAPFQLMGPLLYFNRRHIIDEKHANIANKILYKWISKVVNAVDIIDMEASHMPRVVTSK